MAVDRSQEIYCDGQRVYRPLSPWSTSVYLLLAHVRRNGFHQCPQFLAVENHQEVLSFVEDNTDNYPLRGPIASETALISAARLQRWLHDCSEDFVPLMDLSLCRGNRWWP